MGKRSPLGTKKRVLAGGGDPFSLREGKIPPAADEALVPLAAALSRQCSDKRCIQLAAFQNVGTGLDFEGRHWRANATASGTRHSGPLAQTLTQPPVWERWDKWSRRNSEKWSRRDGTP
jgi:hypothetical protein